MAGRCGCASDRCTCNIVAGDGATVSGNGSPDNPYVITTVAPEASGGGGSGRFSGEMTMFAGPIAPAGWLTCDGSEVSRTVYAALFAVIGVAYGAGDGSTTFNLPPMAGRFPIGENGTNPRGSTGGVDTLGVEHMPQHNHAIDHNHAAASSSSAGAHKHQLDLSAAPGGTGVNVPLGTVTNDRVSDAAMEITGAHTHSLDLPAFSGTSGDAGTASPEQFVPPFTAVHYIIKT